MDGRIEDADPLERRFLVQRPGLGHPRPAAEAQFDRSALVAQRGPEIEREAERVGAQVVDVVAPIRDRVAAVQPLAEAEPPPADRRLGRAGDGFGAHDGRGDAQLRQADAERAQEHRRPDAARDQDGIAGDAALLGHDPRDPSGLDVDAADGASGQDRGPGRAGGAGDGLVALAVLYAWAPVVFKVAAGILVFRFEIDAEAHLDLVRRLDIRRTPTVLVLNQQGHIVRRAVGAPRKADVIAALGEVINA